MLYWSRPSYFNQAAQPINVVTWPINEASQPVLIESSIAKVAQPMADNDSN